ncbi:Myoglobin [Frankliniella fusca]|uniref:Myoglobin n=1 Tax=Frankliniella fusca TaxID=407009 RepID=A0AAE1LF89_9NEOP|nr:Myoglobin [Frankliniella fusca]
MALQFLVLALAISAASCAPGSRHGVDLSQANIGELVERFSACTRGYPNQSKGSFDVTPAGQCVKDAGIFIKRRHNANPNEVITSLPECLRSVGGLESDIAPVAQCLQANIPLPFTYVGGNTYYTYLDGLMLNFALSDCIHADSPSGTCTNIASRSFDYSASLDAIAVATEDCLVRIGADKNEASQNVQCFRAEMNDPSVRARAQEYINEHGG